MSDGKEKVIVASDVNQRDGIGVELYEGDRLLVEIFRDDTEKTRTITTYQESISLERMERAIELFKKEIPWHFIDYDQDYE